MGLTLHFDWRGKLSAVSLTTSHDDKAILTHPQAIEVSKKGLNFKTKVHAQHMENGTGQTEQAEGRDNRQQIFPGQILDVHCSHCHIYGHKWSHVTGKWRREIVGKIIETV